MPGQLISDPHGESFNRRSTSPARLSALDGPDLLVDDRVDTGWTNTLTTRLLREAGTPAVLPFALALTA